MRENMKKQILDAISKNSRFSTEDLAAMLATGIIHKDFLPRFIIYVFFLMRMLAEANTVNTTLNDLNYQKKLLMICLLSGVMITTVLVFI